MRESTVSLGFDRSNCVVGMCQNQKYSAYDRGDPYPSVVEFGLNSNIVSFLFILGPQHLELSGFQRTGNNINFGLMDKRYSTVF